MVITETVSEESQKDAIYFSISAPTLGGISQSIFKSSLSVPSSRRVSEDDISLFELTNNGNDFLERHRTERRRRRRKQESDMNKTVMIICGTFIVCNLPGSLVLCLDPSAKIFPQVK